MTDRELLELAAQATGKRLEWDGHPDQWQPMYYEGKTYHSFDPLTDDGEAFRLAVQLGIYTAPGPGTTCEAVTSFGWACKVSSIDRAGAMRRAIVEAAASVAMLDEQKEKDRLIGGMGQSD